MAFVLEKAVKEAAKARWVIIGPGGSGKTFTSLTIAAGLGETTALIDTNRKQSLVFGGDFNFDVLHMHDNFHPEQLVEALGHCSAYDTTIIDTASAFWSGPGGMLELVDLHSEGRASTFGAGWKEMGPVEKKMIDAMLGHAGHLIVNLRVKTEWMVEPGVDGKIRPTRVGTKPDQRDRLEYEMGIVSLLDDEHTMRFIKSPYKGFDGRTVALPTEELGREYRLWLEDGKQPVTVWELRDRLLEARTLDELREAKEFVQAQGKWNAPMKDEHGDATTLGGMVKRLHTEMTNALREGAKS